MFGLNVHKIWGFEENSENNTYICIWPPDVLSCCFLGDDNEHFDTRSQHCMKFVRRIK